MEAHGFDMCLSPYVSSAVDSDGEIQEVHLLGGFPSLSSLVFRTAVLSA